MAYVGLGRLALVDDPFYFQPGAWPGASARAPGTVAVAIGAN